jgi:hypothetical protein
MRVQRATTDDCESLHIRVGAYACARRLARGTRPYGDGDDLKTCISNSKVITRISTASHQNPQKLSGLSASVVNQNTAFQTRISPIEAVQHLTKNLKNSVDSVSSVELCVKEYYTPSDAWRGGLHDSAFGRISRRKRKRASTQYACLPVFALGFTSGRGLRLR